MKSLFVNGQDSIMSEVKLHRKLIFPFHIFFSSIGDGGQDISPCFVRIILAPDAPSCVFPDTVFAPRSMPSGKPAEPKFNTYAHMAYGGAYGGNYSSGSGFGGK